MLHAKTIRAVFLTALVALAGCAHTVGHDFTRPEQMGVVLGRTTEADIVSRYGEPASRSSTAHSAASVPGKPPSPFEAAQIPGVFTFLRYNYVLNQPPIAGGDMNQKSATFTFWNGVLVGHDFNSSFAADSSNFDEDTAQAILSPRQMSRDAVIAQFGDPGGRFIYPMTPTPGMERLHYSYEKFDVKSHQRQIKAMDIVFNASGQMLDFRAASAANPFAPVVAAGGGGGLLFLPMGHFGGGRR